MIELTEQQATLLGLLTRRASWEEITDTLGISRQAVWNGPINQLQNRGLVRPRGDLPIGALTGTNPSAEGEAVWVEFAQVEYARLTGEGWSPTNAARLVGELARIGAAPHPSPRHSRAQWSGQTLRRVGWRAGGAEWVVQGVLMPHPSGLPWPKAAPKARTVEIWDDPWAPDAVGYVRAPREGWCSVGEVRAELPNLPAEICVGLTLCVAWALEAAAVLDLAALEAAGELK